MAWSGHRTASSAITKSARWKRVRAVVLERDGYACQLRGPRCTGVATQVDHARAIAHGGDPFDPAGCVSVCQPCHSTKTAQDAAAGRVSERRPAERHPGMLP